MVRQPNSCATACRGHGCILLPSPAVTKQQTTNRNKPPPPALHPPGLPIRMGVPACEGARSGDHKHHEAQRTESRRKRTGRKRASRKPIHNKNRVQSKRGRSSRGPSKLRTVNNRKKFGGAPPATKAGATANDNLPLGPVRLRNKFEQPLSSKALLGKRLCKISNSGGGCGELLCCGASSTTVLAGQAGSGIRCPNESLRWKARRRSTNTHELAEGSC